MKHSGFRILMTHSNRISRDEKQMRKMEPYPPLATIQAAAVLQADGFDVSLHDTTFDQDLKRFTHRIEQVRPHVLVIYDDYFHYISKMCLLHMRETAKAMCRVARSRGVTALVASADATDNPGKYLDSGASYALHGEADQTVLELCQALCRGIDPLEKPVAGITGRQLEGDRRTPTRPLISDLASLPLPAWDLLDIEPYRKAWLEHHGRFSLNMVASRGCPFSCNWCAKPIWGRHYALRPASQVAREMALLIDRFKPDNIWFMDDIFGYGDNWVEALSSALTRIGVKSSYTIQTRVDLLTPTVIEELSSSGCREVWLGAESGSQRILDAMNKGINPGIVRSAVTNLRGAGIQSGLFIQFGYPDESFDDIMDTVKLFRATLPDKIGISVTYPLPGTYLYDSVELGGQSNWQHSNDLAMLFHGTYNTLFYRKLHDVLHDELDLNNRIRASDFGTRQADTRLWNSVMEGWLEIGRLEAEHRQARLSDGKEY